MEVKELFSKDNEYYLFTLEKDNLKVEILNFGAIVKSIVYNGIDVTLGYDTIDEYIKTTDYYGATVGRVCNRIGNAKFSLNGKEYLLNKNNGENCLHGGIKGFNKQVWNYKTEGEKLILTYLSKDDEEGFPANMQVKVEFSIENNGLVMEYYATSDNDTVCNLTNHCFFNLNGEGNGDILSHKLQILANGMLENDNQMIPTGKILSVKNTPYDFNDLEVIGKRINEKTEQIKIANGYDNAYVLNGSGFRKVATLIGDKTNIKLEVLTDLPSIQLYSGNFLNGDIGKDGKKYDFRQAVCLETQGYPNAINRPNFPSIILKKNEKYYTKTIYKFSK